MKRLIFTLLCFLVITPAVSAQSDLIKAILEGDALKVASLLKAGANPNEIDDTFTSPLTAACRTGNPVTAKILLDAGAKVDAPRTSKGRTPLMVALAYEGGITITKLLVEYGANVNAVTENGTTPLMIAAGGAKLNVVEYLLSKGANPKSVNNIQMTALKYAENIDPKTLEKIKACRDCNFDTQGVIKLLKSLQ